MPAKFRILIALALGAAICWWWPRENLAHSPESASPKSNQVDQPPAVEPLTNHPPVMPGSTPEPDGLTVSSPAERQLVLDAIDNLEFTFRDFAAALGGNPVGTNAEITEALLGDNLRQVKFPLPEGSTVNPSGELCDIWGSPWFFHQLSGSKMEIRSAGPDRELYSGDDFVR